MTSTAVTTTDKRRAIAPEHQAVIDENRARNAVIQQIRGTIWSKEMNDGQIRALAQYCRENQLDAARHVEVLGGRIYLTAEFYDERGAELLRSGQIVPAEPDYVNADARLDEMAKAGDEWAKDENDRRKRERIKWNVPEDAKAAVVQRFIIAGNGKAVIGVNWCGQKSNKRDPVGDAEPSKTAQTRARRRAWKQIADVIPGYGAIVRPIEEGARALAPILTVEAPETKRPTRPLLTNGGYETEPQAERDENDRPIPRTVEATTETSVQPSGQAATAEEVFGENQSDESNENVEVDVVTGAPLSEAGQWVMPLGEKKGTPIGRIDTERLVSALDVARNAKKYAGFVSAAEIVLEDRRLASE